MSSTNCLYVAPNEGHLAFIDGEFTEIDVDVYIPFRSVLTMSAVDDAGVEELDLDPDSSWLSVVLVGGEAICILRNVQPRDFGYFS